MSTMTEYQKEWLLKNYGRIGRKESANYLRVCPSTLDGWIKELGIARPKREKRKTPKVSAQDTVKYDIEKGYCRECMSYIAGSCAGLVSEEDCIQLLSSSQEYWFLAGAMWLMKQIEK